MMQRMNGIVSNVKIIMRLFVQDDSNADWDAWKEQHGLESKYGSHRAYPPFGL
jgi:hypothetical protein